MADQVEASGEEFPLAAPADIDGRSREFLEKSVPLLLKCAMDCTCDLGVWCSDSLAVNLYMRTRALFKGGPGAF